MGELVQDHGERKALKPLRPLPYSYFRLGAPHELFTQEIYRVKPHTESNMLFEPKRSRENTKKRKLSFVTETISFLFTIIQRKDKSLYVTC